MENFEIRYFNNTDLNYKIAIGEDITSTPELEIVADGDHKVSIVDNLLIRVLVPQAYKVLDLATIRVPNTKGWNPYTYSFVPCKQEYFKIQRISKIENPDKEEVGEIKSVCLQKLTKNLPFDMKLPDEFVLDVKPTHIWYLLRSADYLIENTKYKLTRSTLLPSKTLTLI